MPSGDLDSSTGHRIDLARDGLKIEYGSTRLVPDFKVKDEIKEFCPRVYNFEVEDFHTYYVGEADVWVHVGSS